MKAPLPDNEDLRLRALYELSILDTPPEQSFDDIAQLAMMICQVPIAVVSLVDKDRQWFKSCLGLNAAETHRDVAFCAHAILNPQDLLEVEDATLDYRFVDNALVTGPPGIRFYAGAPLVTQCGLVLGTLCVIDYQPRKLLPDQKSSLMLLANQVVKLLELRESNQKIAEQAEKFSTLYLMSPVAISLNRFADGKFLEANPELLRILGYTESEIVNIGFMDITPPKYESDERKLLDDLCLTGRYGPYEKHLVSKSGDWIPVICSGVLIKKVSGELFIWSIIQDISERKRIDQLKNEFVSTVSHELRTPLTSISAALRMVLGGMLGEVPEKINELLAVAAKNSQRLTLLINDLLDMEKLIAGKMIFEIKPSRVLPLVEQAVSENKAYADQFSVKYQINGGENDRWVLIDHQRMQQVLSNLLSNAAKFSTKDSTVDINLTIDDKMLRISVRDYGQGILPEFQKRIFQKFAQADSTDARKRGGTGLGLAISKELVERMGGKIGFTSEVNQGSNFFAEFPILESGNV
jgi:PAS domain S-box-containing protein